jgi:hypothetical protein
MTIQRRFEPDHETLESVVEVLKLGIRWLPSRFDRPSGRPDLDEMERREPGRYGSLWRGTVDARVGRRALGRRTIDRAVGFATK